MQAFLEVIDRVRGRIRNHSANLVNNEWLTRYALVDPVLRVLGWDTEDPQQVIPEFSTGGNRFDYALLKDGKPYIVVETKALNANLQPAVNQGVNGAVQLGAHYFVCTDGNIWEIYESHKPVPLPDKLVARVQVKTDALFRIVRELILLWRDIGRTDSGEISLDQLSGYWHPGAPPPSSIKMPDGTTYPIKHWYKILVVVAKYALPLLQQSGRLPLKSPKIANSASGFQKPAKLDNIWYIETHGRALQIIQNSIDIARQAGLNPSDIKVVI